MNFERVGIVSLGEAGNLGDDLILLAVVKAISKTSVAREVSFLGHGLEMDWSMLKDRFGIELEISRRSPGRDFPLSKRESLKFADCDALVVGGGGLLQDVHHPVRPYHWLRYIPSKVPTIGVGLGAGPLSARWDAPLRQLGMPFQALFVRDKSSGELLNSRFGWSAAIAADFVDATFLEAVSGAVQKPDPRKLGVALREWPGLDAAAIARHILAVAERREATSLEFFVLEAKQGEGPDVDFARRVASHVSMDCNIRVYNPREIVEFVRAMGECSSAVSMKLHSSAIWAHMAIDVFPIIYAPKTAALFGQSYDGLTVSSVAVTMDDSWSRGPRSATVLQDWLTELLESNPSSQDEYAGFSLTRRSRYQLESAFHGLRRKLLLKLT